MPYFWQDSNGKEIDCLLVDGENIVPIEIKSGKTITNSYFNNLKYWYQLVGMPEKQGYVVYGGDQSMQTSTGSFISWRQLDRVPV
jgi:predicted AAA+ superfamily ATPase